MSRADPAPDTIFALSSGALPAAIAVVRISGPGAGDALQRLAGRLPPPRVATLAALRSPEPPRALLDRALVLWLPGPATATGEDMAELHLHGGRATVAAISAALARLPGLRAAGPGAFTRRAFANGRLDLAEAEGLADLLEAETEGQRRAALRLAEGGLGRLIAGWRDRLLALAAGIEAHIEFAEEHDDVGGPDPTIGHGIAALAGEIATALAEPPAERLRDGVRIVIAGPVNTGKSSLLNALAGRDAAIATPLPGTTRDLVEVPVVIGGVACVLVDSAGVRETDDAVERIGIERARDAARAADLLLWLGDPDDAPPVPHRLTVHGRADLPDRGVVLPGADLAISVVTGEGMAALRQAIADRARLLLPPEDRVALNRRHRDALAAVRAALTGSGDTDPILLADDLRAACRAMDRVIGQTGTEDMLDTLFGRFCIGK